MKINFTKVNLEQASIPAAGKRNVLYDNKVLGLQCRITHTGIKTFCFYKRVKNGRPERITLGKFPEVTIENARVMSKQLSASLAKGESVADIKRAERREMTFEMLFQEYLEKHSRPKKKTWKDDLTKFNLYLKKPLGHLRFTKISKADLIKIHVQITSEYKRDDLKKTVHERRFKSGSYANRVMAVVSSVYGWAMSMDLADKNPASRIKRFKEKSRDRFLQPDEVKRFFAALAQEENKEVQDFIMLALLTGARKKYILSMRWDQISFSGMEWRIPSTKNDDPLRIPLVPEAIEILKSRANNSEFVLAANGKSGHLHDPRKGFHRVLNNAGISNMRIHDLRRTLASWQARTGASLLIIGKTLGHKSPQATAIYSRLDIDPVRQAMQIATRAMIKAAHESKYKISLTEIFNLKCSNNLLWWVKPDSKLNQNAAGV
jgi:integrase